MEDSTKYQVPYKKDLKSIKKESEQEIPDEYFIRVRMMLTPLYPRPRVLVSSICDSLPASVVPAHQLDLSKLDC